MTRQNQIGFSRRIRLEWLESTACLVMAGNDLPPPWLLDGLR